MPHVETSSWSGYEEEVKGRSRRRAGSRVANDSAAQETPSRPTCINTEHLIKAGPLR